MELVKGMLVGGPEGLPTQDRVRDVNGLREEVKIPFGAGYEHFAHSGEFSECTEGTVPVFRWCGRTRVAE